MTLLYFVTAPQPWRVMGVVSNLISKTVFKFDKIEHETEISFFNMKDYEEFKENPEEKW